MLASTGYFFCPVIVFAKDRLSGFVFCHSPLHPLRQGTKAGEYGDCSLLKSRITNVASGWCDHPAQGLLGESDFKNHMQICERIPRKVAHRDFWGWVWPRPGT